jgi:hypothetical protein
MRLGRGRLMWRAMRSRSRAPTTRMVAIRSALAASTWSERQTCLVLVLRARALWRRIVRIFFPKKASLPPATPSKRGARRAPTERGRAAGPPAADVGTHIKANGASGGNFAFRVHNPLQHPSVSLRSPRRYEPAGGAGGGRRLSSWPRVPSFLMGARARRA